MSESSAQRYTVTAALPYTNGPIHIGHLAGVYVPADIYVRYLRSRGRDVAFICGSDEHGVAITMRARKEGITPQQVVDKYHTMIKDSFAQFGIAFDHYSRTSAPVHHETAAAFFKKLYQDGRLDEQVSEQYYDEEYKQFLADRYIKGECPNCHYADAYGDQCESCGTSLSPNDLINPVSTLSGKKPVKKETKHWYLPLNEHEGWLRKWILDEHKDWKTNVLGQCKSWLDQGLQPRAMTRDLDWGVKVPVAGADGKVLYVWFDAPIGYISATKEWAQETGADWEPYWKGDDTKLVHFIGKDNIVFHCIIFPTVLKLHGDFVLPENVPANEFMNLEGNKISTSRNWAVWLHEYLEAFPGKEDVLRYMLTANMPEAKDNDFTWKDFQSKNNSELVGNLGNFINRALVLTHKNFDGKVPARGTLYDAEKNLLKAMKEAPAQIAAALEQYRFREALAGLMDLSRKGNVYFAETEPWKLVKTDKERVGTIMNIALQLAANLSVLMEAFLPHSRQKLNAMLGLDGLNWDDAGRDDLLEAGKQLNPAQLLFEKIDDKVVEEQVQKLNDTKAANEVEAKGVEPSKAEIQFDDFMKMDMRVGTVLEAEKVKKSKKLLKLLIDTGIDKRTILSGIAEHFSAEEMVGKQVTVLVNLAPRKMMGIESQGMVLMAEDKDGTLRLMTPQGGADNGAMIS